jgi:hypothetical protein
MTDAQAGTRTRGTARSSTRRRPRSTAWASWIWFAAMMMIMMGTFSAIFGLVALFDDSYYTVGPQGLLVFDLTQWGWIHLTVGVLAVFAGIALFGGAMWARVVAVGLAMINAIAQLAFTSAYPVWAVIVIALDVLVIWALIVHGDELAAERRS